MFQDSRVQSVQIAFKFNIAHLICWQQCSRPKKKHYKESYKPELNERTKRKTLGRCTKQLLVLLQRDLQLNIQHKTFYPRLYYATSNPWTVQKFKTAAFLLGGEINITWITKTALCKKTHEKKKIGNVLLANSNAKIVEWRKGKGHEPHRLCPIYNIRNSIPLINSPAGGNWECVLAVGSSVRFLLEPWGNFAKLL